MPQKPLFSREEIIDLAYEYVRNNSIDSLSARTLAKELGTSVKPIFGLFSSMDDLKAEIIKKARKEYNRTTLEEIKKDEYPFRGVGKGMYFFACEEPKLFKLLFMHDNSQLKEVILNYDDNYELIIKSIMESYYIKSYKKAEEIYKGMWVLGFGISSLVVNNICTFSFEEVRKIYENGIFGYVDKKELLSKKEGNL